MWLKEAGSVECEAVDPVDDQIRHDGESASAICLKALAFAGRYNVAMRHDVQT
jgi:hypothetical protein